jgi:alkylated DNA repair dioxygenase AlkB
LVRADKRSEQPAGFRLIPELLTVEDERELSEVISGWELRRIPMRGGYLRRQMLCFGVDFGPNFMTLREGAPLPSELCALRERCAASSGYQSTDLTQAIVQHYPPGATIGWHRDDLQLGPIVIGVSLRSAATLRFSRERTSKGRGAVAIPIPPRSVYMMQGEARYDWFHSLAPVRQHRVSVTFRAA